MTAFAQPPRAWYRAEYAAVGDAGERVRVTATQVDAAGREWVCLRPVRERTLWDRLLRRPALGAEQRVCRDYFDAAFARVP